MGKAAEQVAKQKRNEQASTIFADYRACKINTGEMLDILVSEGFYTKGELKSEYKIGCDAFQRAARGESTGVTTENREKLLRAFTAAHGVKYTPPANTNTRYRPVKGAASPHAAL